MKEDTKEMIIKRVWETEYSTYGNIIDKTAGMIFALTIELPWKENQPNISCIPAGKYTCCRCWYNKGKYETFQIMNVSNRTNIKFHIANKTGRKKRKIKTDLLGCVGIGESFDPVWTIKGWVSGILQSGKGFKEFMSRLKNVDEFELEIIDCIDNNEQKYQEPLFIPYFTMKDVTIRDIESDKC